MRPNVSEGRNEGGESGTELLSQVVMALIMVVRKRGATRRVRRVVSRVVNAVERAVIAVGDGQRRTWSKSSQRREQRRQRPSCELSILLRCFEVAQSRNWSLILERRP